MDATADIHISLPRDLLTELDHAARARGLRRVGLVRALIEDYLREAEQQRKDHEMYRYAEELAPASGEFIRETDDLTVTRLLRETEW